MLATSHEPEQPVDRARREHSLTPQRPPYGAQLVAVHSSSDPGAVYRTDRRSYDHVGPHASLAQGRKHPHLSSAQAGAPREHEGCDHRRSPPHRATESSSMIEGVVPLPQEWDEAPSDVLSIGLIGR